MNFQLPESDIKNLLTYGQKTLTSTTWDSYDMARAYDLVNKIYGIQKVDTGCSGCRRETLAQLKRAYHLYVARHVDNNKTSTNV